MSDYIRIKRRNMMFAPCDEGLFFTRSSMIAVIFGLDGLPLGDNCILSQILMRQCSMLAEIEPAGHA